MKDHVSYPQFISNGPCGEDLFAGKAHQRIAERIAHQLLPPHGPHVIGLDGSWGSGKSNIIRMIEGIIHRKSWERALLLMYNVWGHQSDSLCRSILDELTELLTYNDPPMLPEEKRSELIDEYYKLQSQHKEIRTHATTRSRKKTIGLSIRLWLRALGARASYVRTYNAERRTLHEDEFTSKSSSTQFKKWIGKLNDGLRCPLIIVCDDIDRLSAQKVQEFWAAIHTLFTEVKYERIKVIVPFDRSHIISAFREENIQGEDSTPKCYGNEFIDKTFDAVYRVPPPILSDWKDYLSTQWKTAFGKEPEGSVTQIYDLLANGKTPREIIAFINECVTTRRTCSQSEIPDEYIALFAVGKHEIVKDPQHQLLELEFCRALSYKYDNDETRKYLSAIHYQLDPQKALDTIYVDQLRRELDKGEATLLHTLITKSIFTSILEQAIAKITHVGHATEAFHKVEESTTIPQNFWDELVQKGVREKSISIHTLTSDALRSLLGNSSTGKSRACLDCVIGALYDKYRISYAPFIEFRKFNGEDFYHGINEICEIVQELGVNHLHPLSKLHVEYTTPELYIKFVEIAGHDSENYKIQCDTDSLDEYIDKLMRSLLDQEETKWLDEYYADEGMVSAETYYSGQVASCIKASISANEATMLFQHWVDNNLIAWGVLLSEKQIAQFITEAEKGSLLHNCTICQLIVHGGSRAHPEINAVLEEEDDELVQTLSELISQFINYDRLLLKYKMLWKYALYRKLVQKLFINRDRNEIYRRWTNIAKIIHHYSEITSTLDLPLEAILNACEISDFHYTITTETVPYIPAQFFVDTKELGQYKLVQHCRETGIQYLDTLSKEEWEVAINENNHAYELLIALRCAPPENSKEVLAQAFIALILDLIVPKVNDNVRTMAMPQDR